MNRTHTKLCFSIASMMTALGAATLVGCLAAPDDTDKDLSEDNVTEEISEALVTVRHERQVSQGRDHACAINAAGALSCWGTNAVGQIGDGIKVWQNSTWVSGGDMICEQGTPYAAQCYVDPQPVVGMGSGVTHVAAGHYHTCAIKAGQVYCWGRNIHGVLGIGGTNNCDWYPTPMAVSLPATAVDIVAGTSHSCALTTGGDVYCWGLSNSIGAGSSPTHKFCGSLWGSTSPLKVSFPDVPAASTAVTRLASAPTRATTCALHVDGGVSCWGAPDEQQGAPDEDNFGSYAAKAVVRNHGTQSAARLTGASAVAVSQNRTGCALFASDGHVECWAKVGDSGCSRASGCSPEPQAVVEQTAGGDVTLLNATQIAGGESVFCAMTAADTLRCWGSNDTCVVGSGPFAMSKARPLTNADGTAVVTGYSVTVGQQTSCIRRRNGEVHCAGADLQSEHGDSSPNASHCSFHKSAGNLLLTSIP